VIQCVLSILQIATTQWTCCCYLVFSRCRAIDIYIYVQSTTPANIQKYDTASGMLPVQTTGLGDLLYISLLPLVAWLITVIIEGDWVITVVMDSENHASIDDDAKHDLRLPASRVTYYPDTAKWITV
jgi:hypothetical protein